MRTSPNGIPTPIPIARVFDEEDESFRVSVELGEATVDWAVKLAISIVEEKACCAVEVVRADDEIWVVVEAVEDISRVLIGISIVALP